MMMTDTQFSHRTLLVCFCRVKLPTIVTDKCATGTAIPGQVTYVGNNVTLRFKSDFSSAGRGFKLTYTSTPTNEKPYQGSDFNTFIVF